MQRKIWLGFILLFCLSLFPALSYVNNFTKSEIEAARITGLKISSAVNEAIRKTDPAPIYEAKKEWLVWSGDNSAFIYTKFSTLCSAFSQASDLTSQQVESAIRSRAERLAFEVELESSFIPRIRDLTLDLKIKKQVLTPDFQRSEIAGTPKPNIYKVKISALFQTGELKGNEKIILRVLSKETKQETLHFDFDLAGLR